MIVTIVVAVGAVLAGVFGRRLLRRQLESLETPTLTVRDFVLPLQALTVFVLAFVLVMASNSNGRAEEAVRKEAKALDHMYEVADFAPAPQRQRLQADVICYVRSVRSSEWPAMAHGHGSTGPSTWTSDFHAALQDMGTDAAPFTMLLASDKERDQYRQTRVAESTPTIPSTVYWVMLAALAVLVVVLGLCLPQTKSATVTATLIVTTALLTSVLLVIRDVERPFSGMIQISSGAMTAVDDDLTKNYTATHGDHRMPCDEQGNRPRATH
ncbi:DUF4239 domain-containing protein [Streptomyces sp. NPDC050147]|uniref:bestrophin-like domain n=1 Tax=Streptomyces sp. NPDC050147 TaxID=3155513 RepID=UPI0034397CEB